MSEPGPVAAGRTAKVAHNEVPEEDPPLPPFSHWARKTSNFGRVKAERSYPGFPEIPDDETKPEEDDEIKIISHSAQGTSSKNVNGHADGRAPLLAGISKAPEVRRFIRTTRIPKNVDLAVALTAGPSRRPDGPMPETRLPVATRPASFMNDGRPGGAPCRITTNDGRHFALVPASVPQNGHSSTVLGSRGNTVSRNQMRSQLPVYRNAATLAPPGYYPALPAPSLSLPNTIVQSPACLPHGKYYRYYQIIESVQNPKKVERFLRHNGIPYEIAEYPVEFAPVQDLIAELEDLKEKLRVNLVIERNYRDTEVKCLQGLLELCVVQAKDIEAQSKKLSGFNEISFANNQQSFLQFIKTVKDRVECCLANIKTDLHIPVDLAPPSKSGPTIRQVQLQKTRPEEVITAEDLMTMSETEKYAAECRRRQAIIAQHTVNDPKLPTAPSFDRTLLKSRRKPLNPSHNPPTVSVKPQDVVRPETSQPITTVSDEWMSTQMVRPATTYVEGLTFGKYEEHNPAAVSSSSIIKPLIAVKPELASSQDPQPSKEEPDDMEIFVDIEDDHSTGTIFPLAQRPSSKSEATPSPAAPLSEGSQSKRSHSPFNIKIDYGQVPQSESSRIGSHPMPTGVIVALQLGDISHLRYADFEWLRSVQNDDLKKKLMPLYNKIDWKEYGRLYRIMERATLHGKLFTEERLDSFFAPEKVKINRTVDPAGVNNTYHLNDVNFDAPTCSSSEISYNNQWQMSGPPSHTGSTPSPLASPAVISKKPATQAQEKFDHILQQLKMGAEIADEALGGLNQPRRQIQVKSVKLNQNSNTIQNEIEEFTRGRVLCRLCNHMTRIRDLKDLMRHASIHVEQLKSLKCYPPFLLPDQQMPWKPLVERCFPELAEKIFRKVHKKQTPLHPAAVNTFGALPLAQLDRDYPCQECGEIIHIQQGKTVEVVCEPLVDHLMEKHRLICTPHRCEECGYINAHEWIVRLHISVRHPEKALNLTPVRDMDEDNIILFVRDMFLGIDRIIGERVDEEQEDITEAISNIQRNGLTQEGLQKPPGGERKRSIPIIKQEPVFEDIKEENEELTKKYAIDPVMPKENIIMAAEDQNTISPPVEEETIQSNGSVDVDVTTLHNDDEENGLSAFLREDEQDEADASAAIQLDEQHNEDNASTAFVEEEQQEEALASPEEDEKQAEEAAFDVQAFHDPTKLSCQMCSKYFDVKDEDVAWLQEHDRSSIRISYWIRLHARSHFRVKKYECSCGNYGNNMPTGVRKHVQEKGAGHKLQIHNNDYMHFHWHRMVNTCFPDLKTTFCEVPSIKFPSGGATVSAEESQKLMAKRSGRPLEYVGYPKRRSQTVESEPPSKKAAVSAQPSPIPEPAVKNRRGRPSGSKTKRPSDSTISWSSPRTFRALRTGGRPAELLANTP